MFQKDVDCQHLKVENDAYVRRLNPFPLHVCITKKGYWIWLDFAPKVFAGSLKWEKWYVLDREK